MKQIKTIGKTAIVTLAVVLIGGRIQTAGAAGTPEQQCEAGKHQAVGKYTACLSKAEKSYVVSGALFKYEQARLKCQSKLIGSWSKLEAAAVAAGATCPSSDDRPEIKDFLDACVASVATAVGGGALAVDPVACEVDLASCGGNVATCSSDLVTCLGDLSQVEAGLTDCEAAVATCESAQTEAMSTTSQVACYNDAGSAIACAGTGQDGDTQAGHEPAFIDNGDGTITDYGTGLMWEKLSNDGSIHEYTAEYTLTNAYAKVANLNSAAFAGHSDWRLPNVRELESIVFIGRATPAVQPIFQTGCTGGCSVLTCSCTRLNVYYTSSTYTQYTPAQWKINMEDGDVYAGDRNDTEHVRAVRTAN